MVDTYLTYSITFRNYPHSENGGEIVFGDINPERYTGEISWINLVENENLKFYLEG